MSSHEKRTPLTRREALCRVGNGFGMMAFAGMLNQSLARAGVTAAADGTLTGRALDYPQRVKRVIFLFMNGGLSQVDSFHRKPRLQKFQRQPLPGGAIKNER